jgi:AMMECR1 domain-containing protein
VNLIPVPVSGIGVTLYYQRVFGCSVSMRSNLDQALVAAATAAAGDRRFPRITAARLRKLRIVVSVLYRPRHASPCRKAAAAQHLRLGTDSVAVSNGKRIAIFLDYVAHQHSWTAQQLVTALLQKADLRDTPLRWTTYRTATWLQSEEGARALVGAFSPAPQRSANQ